MRLTLLPNGNVRVQGQQGSTEIGAEHPDFERLKAQCRRSAGSNGRAVRVFGVAMMFLGAAGWWYNSHRAATEGEFSIKLCVFVPLAIAGGALMLLRPEWAGPLRTDSTRAQKAALCVVLGIMAVGSAVGFFRLRDTVSSRAPRQSVIAWSPEMGRPHLPIQPVASPGVSPGVTFLGQPYRLGSFNQKSHAMWEFVSAGQTVDDWTTLLTIIDREDARTREDLDRLAEGILSAYRSRGGQILLAKTMGQTPQTAFNYVVAAFDEPSQQRYEINFVKMSIGPRNAVVTIYGVRISDARDYRKKASAFLTANSAEIGRALESLRVPDPDSLPRRIF